MTTLKIQRKSKLGCYPEITVYCDGELTGFCHTLSRKLTKTENETGAGIFTNSRPDAVFFRGSANVTIDFNEIWETADKSTDEIMEDIVERVDLVNKAFATKYPDVDQVTIREF